MSLACVIPEATLVAVQLVLGELAIYCSMHSGALPALLYIYGVDCRRGGRESGLKLAYGVPEGIKIEGENNYETGG